MAFLLGFGVLAESRQDLAVLKSEPDQLFLKEEPVFALSLFLEQSAHLILGPFAVLETSIRLVESEWGQVNFWHKLAQFRSMQSCQWALTPWRMNLPSWNYGEGTWSISCILFRQLKAS